MKLVDIQALEQLKSISNPIQVGKLIFFIETELQMDSNHYVQTIKSYHTETEEVKVWSPGGTVNQHLTLSTDQRYLFFISNHTEDKKAQLFRMSLEGGAAEQLTKVPKGISHYLQANDHSIYYQWSEATQDKEGAEQAEKSEKLEAVIVEDLTYKADGAGYLEYDKAYYLSNLDLNSLKSEQIMERSKPFKVNFVARDETYLLWSESRSYHDEWQLGENLYRHNLSNGEDTLIAISQKKGSISFVSANPSQTDLLMIANTFDYAFVTLPVLYRYEVATGQLTAINPEFDDYIGDIIVADFQQNKEEFPIEWLDDEAFLFIVTAQGRTDLYRGDIAGNYHCLLDQPLHLTGGNICPGSKEILVTYSSVTLPSALGKFDIEERTLTLVYDPNATTEYHYQAAEEINYTDSTGQPIYGWYLPPVEESSANEKSHPAILYIHGGPQVCYGETFFHEMQYFAAQGYGVMMLNPRGSNGYGQAHVASILGDYGNVDYQDLMTGLDYVLEQHPEIDQSHLYVAGGSYGGFMTNWIVGHTDRFRAACTQRCISNWISFYGTSDIGAFFVECQLERDLSDSEGLWNLSPLKYAHQSKTPLLILHGREDYRCPLEQAQQMYIAMKKKGIDTKMIEFPSSSHGLSRNGLPNLRVARIQAIKDWFKKHS